MIRRTMTGIVLHGILLALAGVSLIPFAWLVCATCKGADDFFSYTFLPWDHLDRLTLDNYRQLFAQEPFAVWMVNSIFLASAYTAIVVTLSSLGGFALAKYRFPGRKPLMLVMLATMLVPSQVLLLPNYELMYKFGWLDSYAAILVPSAVSVFGMFLFRQAMLAVPDELLQAGRIDGCSEMRLWWEVALPVVRPMIGAYTLLSFMSAWNSFLWPQVILQDPAKYTLPIGLANMIGLPQYQSAYGILMAGTLLSILPVVLLFFVLQRDFVAGLASGAVKG
ncbi:MAG TPA: carbohydrate ABC transporter permease [Tepidisphaeraceae bacterium]|jgi:ABC-type glycerol-3-phosphate transport system permease component